MKERGPLGGRSQMLPHAICAGFDLPASSDHLVFMHEKLPCLIIHGGRRDQPYGDSRRYFKDSFSSSATTAPAWIAANSSPRSAPGK